MIKHITAKGLQGRLDIDADFHPDINIITGINGSGKTTLIKVIWYLVSANLERIFREIKFTHIRLDTSEFYIELRAETSEKGRENVTITHNIKDLANIAMPIERLAREPAPLRRLNQRIGEITGSTVFFPTFRRIEGGFSLVSNREGAVRHRVTPEGYVLEEADGIGVDSVMRTLSSRMSVGQHKFVTSLSTEDLVDMITARYATTSESANKLLQDTASNILDAYQQVKAGNQTADDVLKTIAGAARSLETHQEHLLKPITAVSQLVKALFQTKGIVFDKKITLGDTQSAIKSDLLSAGEKQMLSFLVYNSFYQGAAIFIDEPEISLHVDWQRRLFPLMMDQATPNQFFVATHSPFIYQKYSDKEILLSESRGE